MELLLAAALILITAIAGGAYPFANRLRTNAVYDFPSGEALASGVFLGAGLLHMLGDSARDFTQLGYDYPLAFLLAGTTFLGLLLLEHLGREVYEHQGTNARFALLAFIMLTIHSFLEGAALGVSSSLTVMLVIMAAIVAHKWAASFALAVQINKSSLKPYIGIILFLIFALMTPIGILFGDSISHGVTQSPLLEPIFTALAAGTFLYLGTLHGLSQAILVQKCCNLKHFSLVVVGFIIMAVVALWT